MPAKNRFFYLGLIVLLLFVLSSGCQIKYLNSDDTVDFSLAQNFLDSFETQILRTRELTVNYISEVTKNKYSISPPIKTSAETGPIVTFLVQVPVETPLEDSVYLTLLDEVTGLALNTVSVLMEEQATTDGSSSYRIYTATMTSEIGSIIKYRYERRSEQNQVAEHFSDGSPIRYRMLLVTGSGKIEDIVSRWTDTKYNGPTGRIMGQAIDHKSSKPIPNLLISVGGAQTVTNSNGSFVIEELQPGTHNLVAYAMDGSYKPFQQGAIVAADSTTPAHIELTPADFVDVTFIVKVPEETPPTVPMRIAGNLHQLGNSFANLSGGLNTINSRMPVIFPDEEGNYKLTLSLPTGTDLRYKYTLGDGYWNAEHSKLDINLFTRQLIVPEEEGQITDFIDTWRSGNQPPLIFDVTVPESTPDEDYISIQFRPAFGWTEPIPMWQIADNRWAYILYNPLDLPGGINYRYCRNGQCGLADDSATPGPNHEGRSMEGHPESKSIIDQVLSWTYLNLPYTVTEEISATIQLRGDGFWTGVELLKQIHPSWIEKMPDAFESIADMGANWVILSPTWTFGYNHRGNNPPIFKPTPGYDALWFDMIDATAVGSEMGLGVAHYPKPNFLIDSDEWWLSAPRDYSWWLIWFNQYNEFIMHHADLAEESGADALVIGGDWISPALPGASLPDGSYSGVPADADNRWRELITETRRRFIGEIVWAYPATKIENLPTFVKDFDYLYLEFDSPQLDGAISDNDFQQYRVDFNNFLERNQKTIQEDLNLKVLIGLSYPSSPDMETQYALYEIALEAVNQRDWINGLVSGGFYPPATLQDNSSSIHGKPAYELLSYWYPRMLEE